MGHTTVKSYDITLWRACDDESSGFYRINKPRTVLSSLLGSRRVPPMKTTHLGHCSGVTVHP